MNHRSHDREALAESRTEPGPRRGSGSGASGRLDRLRRHDARNWLAVARGHLDLLEHSLSAEGAAPEAADRLQAVEDALKRCRGLLEGRPGASPGAPPGGGGSGPESPVEVARRTAEHLRARYPALEIHVAMDALGPVAIEPATLANVLLNLGLNAARALDGGPGTLEIRGRKGPEGVILEVRDDGPGMDAATVARCRRPGFSSRGEVRDHGWGLVSVEAALRSIGGALSLESAPGQGTCVRLHLPAEAAGARGTEPACATILLVEDEIAVAEVFEAMVAVLGHRLRHHGRAEEVPDGALAEADLLLVDQGLPGLPGADWANRIRQSHPTLPIVLLTGDPAAAAQAPAAVDRVVGKPLGLDALRELIDVSLQTGREGLRPRHRGARA